MSRGEAARIVLFVEGHTEDKHVPAFLHRWLDDRLEKPVRIHPVRFEGWPELVRDAKQKTQLYLEDPRHQTIAVVSLLDLYGLQLPYPDTVSTITQRIRWAKSYMETQVAADPRFHQFFAVHVTEAWLLSNPDAFSGDVRAAVEAVKQPEKVNFKEPPAKWLDVRYRRGGGQRYKKVRDGRRLFAALRPELAYDRCPHLKQMLDSMLQLCFDAGRE